MIQRQAWGELPGELATPLAVVLNELMQNAVDHAFPHGDDDEPVHGHVQVRLERKPGVVDVDVVDDGVGLPEGFTLSSGQGLGMSIVQALVTGELGGELDVSPGDNGQGTRFHVRIPFATAAATKVVEPS